MATLTVNTKTRTYRDLDLNFIANPVTGDVSQLTGDAAVIRSVRNLIFSNFYERPFHPEIGSGVRGLLFEPLTPITMINLKNAIEEVIRNFEPRVRVDNIVVQGTADENRVQVLLRFFILNNTSPTQISVFLERVR